ncbi:type IV pilus twitching motility protein PilT [Clostridium sp.]|uniref:type IV pilus twitching motility protein PilT n=1 Tax=Clostridium sp. TaxID=1506 RepID=UPI0026DD4782|nr:type IV pilus twitching motility protein PilT [Clostridium sp.]MDO5038125.1 type IV pilus twitching motility protein PilT [Clostridium sp.]
MYTLKELLEKTIECKASDLHLTADLAPMLRINGKLKSVSEEKLSKDDLRSFSKELLGNKFEKYIENGEIDSSYSLEGVGRFRVNVFRQLESDAIAIRSITLDVPTLEELNHPNIIKELVAKRRGLILVTGPTGSGKSTTLAAMINEINSTRSENIITLEDPIEYIHKHKKSIINQREIGRDSKSYKNALRAALREDPDVILIGEMRDLETISIAITAAETGHLVLSTLHTIGATQTIDRIIDVFPPYQQQQIRVQLASVLQGVISQQLIETIDNNNRVAAFETMIINPAIQNQIREGKTHQIQSVIQTGSKFGMKTMDMYLVDLINLGIIDKEVAITYALDKEMINRMMKF